MQLLGKLNMGLSAICALIMQYLVFPPLWLTFHIQTIIENVKSHCKQVCSLYLMAHERSQVHILPKPLCYAPYNPYPLFALTL